TDENLLEGIDEFVVSLCEILEVIAGYFRPFVYKAERVLLHAFRLHAFGDVLDFFFGGFIFFLRFVQIGLLQELLYAGTRLPEQDYDDRFFALEEGVEAVDRKSTRLNSSHVKISYAVFCLKKKNKQDYNQRIRNNEV